MNEVAKVLKPTLASKQVIINMNLLHLMFLIILEFDYISIGLPIIVSFL